LPQGTSASPRTAESIRRPGTTHGFAKPGALADSTPGALSAKKIGFTTRASGAARPADPAATPGTCSVSKQFECGLDLGDQHRQAQRWCTKWQIPGGGFSRHGRHLPPTGERSCGGAAGTPPQRGGFSPGPTGAQRPSGSPRLPVGRTGPQRACVFPQARPLLPGEYPATFRLISGRPAQLCVMGDQQPGVSVDGRSPFNKSSRQNRRQGGFTGARDAEMQGHDGWTPAALSRKHGGHDRVRARDGVVERVQRRRTRMSGTRPCGPTLDQRVVSRFRVCDGRNQRPDRPVSGAAQRRCAQARDFRIGRPRASMAADVPGDAVCDCRARWPPAAGCRTRQLGVLIEAGPDGS